MLLRVKTDDERGNVDDLLADTDVALTDQDTGVVDGLGKTEFVDLGLFGGGELAIVDLKEIISGRT